MADDRSPAPVRHSAATWLVLAACLAAVLVAAWVLSTRESDPAPADHSLRALTSAEERFDGDRVRTVGIIRRFGPEDGATRLHYVVEDDDQNRIGLTGGDPDRYVDRMVEVVGTFRFAPDVGRWLDVETIQPR
jgi:hypothetical protein